MYFANRCTAGRWLATPLERYRSTDPIVLGLPRGGVPVAFEVAHALGARLDLLVVRKVGAPENPELAIGAVGRGVTVIDRDTVQLLGVPEDRLARAVERARAEVEQGLSRLREPGEPWPELKGRTVIVVDDGLATGATAEAACRAVRQLGAARVVLAVPVGSPEAVERLRPVTDDVVCLYLPEHFGAVGYWYVDFTQTTDEEVRDLLKRARLEREAHFAPAGSA